MSVNLRKKSLDSSRYSLYLDIYINGVRNYEFLRLYLYKKPRTPIETESNKEVTRLAEEIAAKKSIEISSSDYDYTPNYKKNTRFIDYLEDFVKQYNNKDKRIAVYMQQKFLLFLDKRSIKREINAKYITPDLCISFKDYLQNEASLNGETPYNYFSKFKKVLKTAYKEGVFSKNPVEFVENRKQRSVLKDVLSEEEVMMLAKTPCTNAEVRRAFLFSLNTAFRFCDVQALTWSQIDLENKRVTLAQKKTGKPVTNPLNSNVVKILGDQGKANELVFKLPSHTGCLKALRKWTKQAGISKHITWHCARHTVGVNLLSAGTDVKTTSGFLGHSSLKYMDVYSRVVDTLKEKAANSLPDMNI